MRPGTFLLILAAVLALTLGGFTEHPALIALGVGLGLWANQRANVDELLRLFA